MRRTYTSAHIINIATHKCLAEKSNLIVAKMSKTALALYINIKQKAREIISGNYNYKCSHVVPAVMLPKQFEILSLSTVVAVPLAASEVFYGPQRSIKVAKKKEESAQVASELLMWPRLVESVGYLIFKCET